MARWLSWLERCPVTAEVRGSSPLRVAVGGYYPPLQFYGWVPEWPKGADCKSVSIAFGGSNPPPSKVIYGVLAQLGEHLPYKQGVIGSSPIRPIFLKMLTNMHNYMFLCRCAGYKVILYNIAG